MPIFIGGGGTTTSSTIVDNEIVNADINSAAAIAQSKLGVSTDQNTDIVAVQESTDALLSLVTVADQRVVVHVVGECVSSGAAGVVTLAYNGVTKQEHDVKYSNTQGGAFSLMYTEIPGAATANITVAGGGGCTINSYKIVAYKFK